MHKFLLVIEEEMHAIYALSIGEGGIRNIEAEHLSLLFPRANIRGIEKIEPIVFRSGLVGVPFESKRVRLSVKMLRNSGEVLVESGHLTREKKLQTVSPRLILKSLKRLLGCFQPIIGRRQLPYSRIIFAFAMEQIVLLVDKSPKVPFLQHARHLRSQYGRPLIQHPFLVFESAALGLKSRQLLRNETNLLSSWIVSPMLV